MKSSVTRRSVLESVLREKETAMKQSSVNGMGLRARSGMEQAFDHYAEECRILRELMQALEYEPVRAAMAEFLEKDEPELKSWQRDVMDGKRTGLFNEKNKTWFYIPKCCIECEHLMYKFNNKNEYTGHYCKYLPEIVRQYEELNEGRMKECPIYGHQAENAADH